MQATASDIPKKDNIKTNVLSKCYEYDTIMLRRTWQQLPRKISKRAVHLFHYLPKEAGIPCQP
jgi:hypothetical protein